MKTKSWYQKQNTVNEKTKRELVVPALYEIEQNRQRKDIRELIGKVKLRNDYDYKLLRQGD